MKPVFEGKIINVISVDNGLIIAYAGLQEEGKTTVAYKMVTFDDGKLTNVPKSLYHISKFGTNYAAVEAELKSPILTRAIILPNNKIFTLEEDGTARLHDSSGEKLWESKIEYRSAPSSAVAICGRSVWACFKEYNVLLRMNLNNMKEELRIGGGKNSPFSEPCDLFVDEKNIYVCNSQDNSIIRVNTNTYVTDVYREFDSPILQYIRNADYSFAVLQNGVYLLV